MPDLTREEVWRRVVKGDEFFSHTCYLLWRAGMWR